METLANELDDKRSESWSGSLTGSGSSPGYDFNNGAQGWTFSNSFSGRVTTPACGYNGSSGGSLRTYAGSTYATSPVIDLSNRVSIPFHAWVHEGRSGCGETPDPNENLQFQYKNAAGTWTAFRTFSGGGAVTSNSQFMTTLPAGAYHSNFQVRIHQNSGSGTCCDYWFVDDVKIVLPPVTEWTSPSFGYNTSNSFSLAEGPYAPMYLNGIIHSLMRKLNVANHSMHENKWEKKKFIGNEMLGKTIGIIGFGNIGKKISEISKAYGINVVVHSSSLTETDANNLEVENLSVENLLEASDIITFHNKLSEKSKYLINSETLKLVKNDAIIVNCARGGLVNEEDIKKALDSGMLGGYGCDVYENEPEQNSIFAGLENVVMTPHIGASTVEAQEKVA